MLENKEIWRDIKGYEGKYQVSNFGRVWSIINQKMLKQQMAGSNYLRVYLRTKNGKTKQEYVHRLVALAFVPNPDSKTQVNHLNEDRTDNRAENLEWVTQEENLNYGTRVQRSTDAKKYEFNIYSKDGTYIGYFKGSKEAAIALGVNKSTILRWASGQINSKEGYRIELVDAS